ncbi:hypothetical protein EDC01DRAFT_60879 [Geopyxis carbonaria]|nr:hypothetical protein EDC01DRAFT_60879 [Geopyxis carbonaria]
MSKSPPPTQRALPLLLTRMLFPTSHSIVGTPSLEQYGRTRSEVPLRIVRTLSNDVRVIKSLGTVSHGRRTRLSRDRIQNESLATVCEF